MTSITATHSSSKLLDQLRAAVRYKHYALSTEKVDVQWVRDFVRWSGMRPHVIRRLPVVLTSEEVSPSKPRCGFLEVFRALAGIKSAQSAMKLRA